ncbi:hypothetical protein FRAHR75_1260013 [Frankia sp. Hr75.2]|nr:hypothetical protein FRAHR75_1260013 [Frankia sp. Hr75.2]
MIPPVCDIVANPYQGIEARVSFIVGQEINKIIGPGWIEATDELH